MVVKFGLSEMAAVAQVRKPHLPTVQAVLNALGVKNTVAEEAAEVVRGCEAAVAEATKEVARLSEVNRLDEQETARQIQALRAARAQRTARTAAVVSVQLTVAENHRLEANRVQRLAEVAKKMR